MNKKELTRILTRLKTFEKTKLEFEQYQTECDIAATITWHAYMSKEIEDKTVADLGCGNGILGIAALILGAKKVFFVEIDKDAIEIAKENLKEIESILEEKFDVEFINKDIGFFNEKVDLVLQNPPFGIQSKKHADKNFLIKAMQSATTIYSIHSADSGDFIKKFTEDNGFKAEVMENIEFPIKKTQEFHKKAVATTKATIWKIESFKR